MDIAKVKNITAFLVIFAGIFGTGIGAFIQAIRYDIPYNSAGVAVGMLGAIVIMLGLVRGLLNELSKP